MTLDSSIKNDIKTIKQAAFTITQADMKGDEKLFNELGLEFGPIARRVFLSVNPQHQIFLNPGIVAERVRHCNHSLTSFEFWKSADLVVALSEFLEFAHIGEEECNASAEET